MASELTPVQRYSLCVAAFSFLMESGEYERALARGELGMPELQAAIASLEIVSAGMTQKYKPGELPATKLVFEALRVLAGVDLEDFRGRT